MMAMALNTGYSGWGAWKSSQVARGVSSDADRLGHILGMLVSQSAQSATAQRWIDGPLESLIEISKDCATANWNGEGALAIGEPALNEACDLLTLLPSSIPSPTIFAEPTGGIAFEWYKSPTKILILSVNGTRCIQFAALLGDGDEAHGKTNFSGSLPRAAQLLFERYLVL